MISDPIKTEKINAMLERKLRKWALWRECATALAGRECVIRISSDNKEPEKLGFVIRNGIKAEIYLKSSLRGIAKLEVALHEIGHVLLHWETMSDWDDPDFGPKGELKNAKLKEEIDGMNTGLPFDQVLYLAKRIKEEQANTAREIWSRLVADQPDVECKLKKLIEIYTKNKI